MQVSSMSVGIIIIRNLTYFCPKGTAILLCHTFPLPCIHSAERDSGYYCTCGRGHEHDGRTDDGRTGGRFPAPPSISIGRQERDAECRHRIRHLGRLAVNKFHLIYSLVPALYWSFGRRLPVRICHSQSTQQKLFGVELREVTRDIKTKKSHIKTFQGILFRHAEEEQI